MRTWTAGEVAAFLESVRGDRLYTAWVLSATSGTRRGEVLALRWSDLDLAAGRVAVRRALIAVHHELSFSEPKTARGRRSVALDPVTVAALNDHRKRQVQERLTWAHEYQDGDLIFAHLDGSPVHPDSFSKAFTRLAKAAGLPPIRLHDLRHSHASIALAAGVHPKVDSDRLGHSTVGLTLDVYSHAIPALQEEAASTVASLIFNPPAKASDATR